MHRYLGDLEAALCTHHQSAKSLFYPYILTIGTKIHPKDYIDFIYKENEVDLDLPEVVHFQHELSHALLFLGTNYGGKFISELLDLMNLYIDSGATVENLDEFILLKSKGEDEEDREYLRESWAFAKAQVSHFLNSDMKYWSIEVGIEYLRKNQINSHIVSIHRHIKAHDRYAFEHEEIPDAEGLQDSASPFEHYYVSPNNKNAEVIRFNSVCLAEALAVLSEISTIEFLEERAARGVEIKEYVNALPLVYRACFEILEKYYSIAYDKMFFTMIALLDISFMCGGFRVGLMASLRDDQENIVLSPADVFLHACASIGDLKLPTIKGEIESFRAKLYKNMGFLSYKDVFNGTASHELRYLIKNYPTLANKEWSIQGACSLFSQAEAFYRFSAQRFNEENFSLLAIVEPQSALYWLAATENAIHFYDTNNKAGFNFVRLTSWDGARGVFEQVSNFSEIPSDQSWGASLLGHVLLNLANNQDSGCPLKNGEPYYCHSKNLSEQEVCTWNGSKPIDDVRYSLDLQCPHAALIEHARRNREYRTEMATKGRVSEEEEINIRMRHFQGR